jgi:hypothetical protein
MSSGEAGDFYEHKFAVLFACGNNITQSRRERRLIPQRQASREAQWLVLYDPQASLLGAESATQHCGPTVPFGLCATSWQTNAQVRVLPL